MSETHSAKINRDAYEFLVDFTHEFKRRAFRKTGRAPRDFGVSDVILALAELASATEPSPQDDRVLAREVVVEIIHERQRAPLDAAPARAQDPQAAPKPRAPSTGTT